MRLLKCKSTTSQVPLTWEGSFKVSAYPEIDHFFTTNVFAVFTYNCIIQTSLLQKGLGRKIDFMQSSGRRKVQATKFFFFFFLAERTRMRVRYVARNLRLHCR